MLLSAIGQREVPIPEHIDIYHLTREMSPSEKTALQCVMEVDEERIKLEKEAERLAHEDCELHTHTHMHQVFAILICKFTNLVILLLLVTHTIKCY